MEFNSFLWNLYRNSDAGKNAIDRDISEYIPCEGRNFPLFSVQLLFFEVEHDNIVENDVHVTNLVDLRKLIAESSIDRKITSLDEAEAFFIEIADYGLTWDFEKDGKTFEVVFAGGKGSADAYGDVIVAIDGLTAGLHDIYPDFFLPYLFPRRFDVLDNICRTFDISLPELPGKLQKRERAIYYLVSARKLIN